MERPNDSKNGMLRAIAVFRLAKAVLLALAGVAALRLLNLRFAATAGRWVAELPFATEHRYIGETLSKFLSSSSDKKELAAGIALGYAALFAVEGVGLWLGRVWAEYLTIVATASFIPFELYEVVRRHTVVRVAVLLANVFIVGYLIWRVRTDRTPSRKSYE
jgi:uncharacterized membrane protein (DUF2068 family)